MTCEHFKCSQELTFETLERQLCHTVNVIHLSFNQGCVRSSKSQLIKNCS